MKDNNTDKGFALCEGGILPQVLPNPSTPEEYAALLFAKPYTLKDFVVPSDEANRLVTSPSGFVSVNPVAQRFLADEVKNATLETMKKGTITFTNFR